MKAKWIALNILFVLVGAIQNASAEPRFVASLYSGNIDYLDLNGTLQVVKMEESVSDSAWAKIYVPYWEIRFTESHSNKLSAVRSDGFPTLPNAQIWFNKDAQVVDHKLNLYCLPQGMNPVQTPPGDGLRLSADQAAAAVNAVAQVTLDPLKRNISLDQLNKICESVLEANAREGLADNSKINPEELLKSLRPKKVKGHAALYEAHLVESEVKSDQVKVKPEVNTGSHMIAPEVVNAASASAITSK